MSTSDLGWSARATASVDAAVAPLCRVLTVVGAGCLAAMGLITVVDVAGRYLLNRPLPGALELSEFALVLLVFFGLGSTGLSGNQVVVDIAIERFPPRLRAAFDAVNAFLSLILWALIAWRTAVHAREIALKSEVSTILSLPASPFVYAAAFGCAVMAVALLGRIFTSLGRAATR